MSQNNKKKQNVRISQLLTYARVNFHPGQFGLGLIIAMTDQLSSSKAHEFDDT